MSKSFLEKRDLKGLTVFSLFSLIESFKEEGRLGENTKIIFFTSLGTITAEKIYPSALKEKDDEFKKENFPRLTMQIAGKTVAESLDDHGNEDVLLNNTSLVLEKVIINNETRVPIMTLFCDEIVGLSFGE